MEYVTLIYFLVSCVICLPSVMLSAVALESVFLLFSSVSERVQSEW